MSQEEREAHREELGWGWDGALAKSKKRAQGCHLETTEILYPCEVLHQWFQACYIATSSPTCTVYRASSCDVVSSLRLWNFRDQMACEQAGICEGTDLAVVIRSVHTRVDHIQQRVHQPLAGPHLFACFFSGRAEVPGWTEIRGSCRDEQLTLQP